MIVGKKLNTGACKSAGAISALILKKKLVVLTIYDDRVKSKKSDCACTKRIFYLGPTKYEHVA